MPTKSNSELIKEITELTLYIKQRYPALYNKLTHESTLVTDSSNEDSSVFVDYLERLNAVLKDHKRSLKEND